MVQGIFSGEGVNGWIIFITKYNKNPAKANQLDDIRL
jgi:hypothetical protein